jgi:hypothetical protein
MGLSIARLKQRSLCLFFIGRKHIEPNKTEQTDVLIGDGSAAQRPRRAVSADNRRALNGGARSTIQTSFYEPRQAEFPDRSIAKNVIVPGANDTDPAVVAAPSIAGRLPPSSTLSVARFSWTSLLWSGSADNV